MVAHPVREAVRAPHVGEYEEGTRIICWRTTRVVTPPARVMAMAPLRPTPECAFGGGNRRE